MGRRKQQDEPDHTLFVKIDGATKSGATQVLSDTMESARRNAVGARGSFIIAPTNTLKDGFTPQQLPEVTETARAPGTCRGIKRNGQPCTAPALQGNYGFCGRHR